MCLCWNSESETDIKSRALPYTDAFVPSTCTHPKAYLDVYIPKQTISPTRLTWLRDTDSETSAIVRDLPSQNGVICIAAVQTGTNVS
jgi:hypothetical protein